MNLPKFDFLSRERENRSMSSEITRAEQEPVTYSKTHAEWWMAHDMQEQKGMMWQNHNWFEKGARTAKGIEQTRKRGEEMERELMADPEKSSKIAQLQEMVTKYVAENGYPKGKYRGDLMMQFAKELDGKS